MPHRAIGFLVALDPSGVLEAHLEEHGSKSTEDGGGQQNMDCRDLGKVNVRQDAESRNIDPCDQPDASCHGKQGVLFTWKMEGLLMIFSLLQVF